MYRTLCVFLALIMLCGAAPLSALAVDGGVIGGGGGGDGGGVIGGGGGGGGDGGGGIGSGGEVGGSSDFVAPATDLVAYPDRWVNGKGLETFDDLEVLTTRTSSSSITSRIPQTPHLGIYRPTSPSTPVTGRSSTSMSTPTPTRRRRRSGPSPLSA